MKLIHVILAWFKGLFTSKSPSNNHSQTGVVPALSTPVKGFRQRKKVWVSKSKHILHSEHQGTFSPIKPLATWHPNTKPLDRRSFWSKWKLWERDPT